MRASRLLSILMTLQSRETVTAQALADECEVSLRTIYRDIDALSAAGIPVYSERGPEGGYRLLDGYRTRLNGLSTQEAEALFLAAFAGPAADLGLGADMAAARTKLLAALPRDLRPNAERLRARFHFDAPMWFGDAEQPQHLAAIAAAVWGQHVLTIRYRSWTADKERRVEPLGIVLKSGTWYLVARQEREIRTFRVSRIADVNAREETFDRPEDFDLAAYWRQSAQRIEAQLYGRTAVVRASPLGIELLMTYSPPFVRARLELGEELDDGWRKVTLPVQGDPMELLPFGKEIEILEPPELRRQMGDVAAALATLYRDEAAPPSGKGCAGAD